MSRPLLHRVQEMPELVFDKVLELSDHEPGFTPYNLLSPDLKRPWKSKPGSEKVNVVLKLKNPARITAIDIGNYFSAYVEVHVAKMYNRDNFNYSVLLPSTQFMDPTESRKEVTGTRVKIFNEGHLNRRASEEYWDVVKIVCSQQFSKRLSFGLSFIIAYGELEVHEPPVKPERPLLQKSPAAKLPFSSPSYQIVLDGKGRPVVPATNTPRRSLPFPAKWAKSPASLKKDTKITPQKSSTSSTIGESPRSSKTFTKTKDLASPKSSRTPLRREKEREVTKEKEDAPAKKGTLLTRMLEEMIAESAAASNSNSVPPVEKPVEKKPISVLEKIDNATRPEKFKLWMQLKAERNQELEKEKEDKAAKAEAKKRSNKRTASEPEVKKKTDKKRDVIELSSSPEFISPPKTSPKRQKLLSSSDESSSEGSTEQPEEPLPKENIPETEEVEKKKEEIDDKEILKDVVFSLSGFQNPKRSEIRDKAIAMGATYSNDLTSEVTHLICAFKNTPKANKSKDSVHKVSMHWIDRCQVEHRRLKESLFAIK